MANTSNVTENTVNETEMVTDADLAKSIELLESLLDSDSSTAKVEKAVIGTGGGLQSKTPSDGDINMDILDEDEELDQEPAVAADKQEAAIGGVETQPVVSGTGGSTKKSLVVDDDEVTREDEEFAKSLAAAFAESDDVIDTAKGSKFAKALVMSTIEGLSITHDELHKAMTESESRQAARISQLEKALTTIAQAVGEIKKSVTLVAESPVRTVTKAAQVLEKGMSSAPVANTLSKSQVSDALLARVMKGNLDQHTLVKFEATGQIDPALLAEIQNGSGR